MRARPNAVGELGTMLPALGAADDARVLAHHARNLPRDERINITRFLHRWAPWLAFSKVEALVEEAIEHQMRRRADTLGGRMGLTMADRTALRITTIGAIDCSKAERVERRKGQERLAGRELDRLIGRRSGRPPP